MILRMLRRFDKIGPKIYHIWVWLSRGQRLAPGVRNPLKSSVTGPSFWSTAISKSSFTKKTGWTPLKDGGMCICLNDTSQRTKLSVEYKTTRHGVNFPNPYKIWYYTVECRLYTVHSRFIHLPKIQVSNEQNLRGCLIFQCSQFDDGYPCPLNFIIPNIIKLLSQLSENKSVHQYKISLTYCTKYSIIVATSVSTFAYIQL